MAATLFVAFAVFVVLNAPISLALGLASLAGLLYTGGLPFILVPQKLFTGIDSFTLSPSPCSFLRGTSWRRGASPGASSRWPVRSWGIFVEAWGK